MPAKKCCIFRISLGRSLKKRFCSRQASQEERALNARRLAKSCRFLLCADINRAVRTNTPIACRKKAVRWLCDVSFEFSGFGGEHRLDVCVTSRDF